MSAARAATHGAPAAALGRLCVAFLALAWAAAGAGCSASPRPSGNGEGDAGRPAPAATVGETRISKAEVSDRLYERFREQWLVALDDLIDERIVAEERTSLGVVVPPGAVDAAVEAEAKARAAQLRARFGDAASLEASVREAHGMDLATWKRDVLAPRLFAALLLERVVRLSARRREQASVRVIVTRDREKARDLRARLEAGADFSLTALRESEDPSKAEGGLLPAFGRGDLEDTAVEAAVFSAPPGALVGPLEVATAAGPEFHLYRVVERSAPWTGDPAALSARLEADLEASSVTRAEYERWAARTRRRHGVRCFAPDGSVLRLPGKDR